MLRLCSCGALAPRNGRCPNCEKGWSRADRSGSASLRLTGRALQRRNQYVIRSGGRRCAKCGAVGVRLEVDHIVPLALGGTDARSNLQALCHADHAEKTKADRRAIRAVGGTKDDAR